MALKTHTSRRWTGVTAAVAAAAGMLLVPSTANASVSPNWVDEQVEFILSEQLNSGAILSTGVKVSPYFGNLAALGLIAADTPASRTGALNWMTWYLDHLNAAATMVPANSVFDYTYNPATEAETPTGDFDSVDSYASTALNLAYAAYSSGDTDLHNFVSANITSYEAIADILNEGGEAGVRIESGPAAGLTFAKPSYQIAYTMDNVEVYSGLADFAQLQADLGRTTQSAHYAVWAEMTKAAIIAKLWNTANNNWDWAYANASNTDVFYAQGTAQLWPIIFGVVEPTDPKAVAGWTQFSDSYPNWYAGGTPDAYPWVSIARAAQIMGEHGHARAHLATVRSRYAPDFTLPNSCGANVCGEWYDAEAGWFLLSAAAD